MPTCEEIRANYKAQHDILTESYYAGTSGLTKEEFDTQHAQIWANMEAELIAAGCLPPPTPPLCTHWAVIDSFQPTEEKPMRVKRVWNGREYLVDCYVTETIKDQYLAGDIVVGDFVLVEFLDDNPDRAVVFAKVLKTW